jgi:hypothetical protein
MRIGTRRDVAARFVEEQVAVALGGDAAAVDANVCARRLRPSSRGDAVDSRAPSSTTLVARRDAMPATIFSGGVPLPGNTKPEV